MSMIAMNMATTYTTLTATLGLIERTAMIANVPHGETSLPGRVTRQGYQAAAGAG